jgi:hypothetical protein
MMRHRDSPWFPLTSTRRDRGTVWFIAQRFPADKSGSKERRTISSGSSLVSPEPMKISTMRCFFLLVFFRRAIHFIQDRKNIGKVLLAP